MSINEMLKNEQITLMRHATESDPVETKMLRRKLSMFERVLTAHPYDWTWGYSPRCECHRPHASGELGILRMFPNGPAANELVDTRFHCQWRLA
jgi:hypothetical protein